MTEIHALIKEGGALALLGYIIWWTLTKAPSFVQQFIDELKSVKEALKSFQAGAEESTEKKLTGFDELKKSVDMSTRETVKAIEKNGICVKDSIDKICKFVLMVVPQSPETQKLAEGLLTGDTKENSKPGKAA